MTDQIPQTRPTVDEAAVERAAEALRSGRHVKGPRAEAFEAEFADFCGAEEAVAVSSGTAALLLALSAVGIGEGDEVFVPGQTFFATVSPVLERGATPVFVDIDSETYTMDPADLARKATEAADPAAVMPVHLYGHPADVDRIQDVADEHDMTVIEDACQAHGADLDGERAGSLGDVGCFSFYPTKNMTVAGDGGMLTTDDPEIAARARRLRNHGRDEAGEHVALGLNYRMDEPRAAVGRAQLEDLAEKNDRRRAVADVYHEELADLDAVELPTEHEDARHVYHQFVVEVDDREAFRDALDEKGIGTGIHYPTPTHEHESIRERMAETPTLEVAEETSDRIVSLPMFPGLSDADARRVCDAIRAHYGARSPGQARDGQEGRA